MAMSNKFFGSANRDVEPLAKDRMPNHIAIIMDGNGRWAKNKGIMKLEGHRRGVEAVRETVRSAIELNISYVTLFSFSSENWSRPKKEVSDLIGLLKLFIKKDLATLHKQNVRVKIIGSTVGVEDDVLALIEGAEQKTLHNTKLTLIVAFNYGGRDEITRAMKRMATKIKNNDLAIEDISIDRVNDHLDTAEFPDPDLMIRTSGELRLSNFLLWQCAYSELVFLDCYWPDFGRKDLEFAIREYQRRDRRFGGRKDEPSS